MSLGAQGGGWVLGGQEGLTNPKAQKSLEGAEMLEGEEGPECGP